MNTLRKEARKRPRDPKSGKPAVPVRKAQDDDIEKALKRLGYDITYDSAKDGPPDNAA